MDSLFKKAFLGLCLFAFVTTVNGCLSYRILREVRGGPVAPPSKALRVGVTRLGEALKIYGAPSRIVALNGRDLLFFERSVFVQNSLAFGIPISDFAGSSVSFSGYSNLTRHDTLILVFSSRGLLEDVVFEKGSALPYMRVLFGDAGKKRRVPDFHPGKGASPSTSSQAQ